MRVVAVTALHQPLVDAVVKGLGKIRFGSSMASIAQLGLILDQQVLSLLSTVRRMAVETANIATGVGGLGKMGLLMTFAVTAQTAGASLLP